MEDFDSNVKYNFNPNSTDVKFCAVKLPAERGITNILNTTEAKQYNLIERNTKLKIKHADIKEKFFDPIIARILTLIQRQLNQARKSQSIIRVIMLVGGFLRNPYFQRRIQEEHRGYCRIIIPDDGAAAIPEVPSLMV